MSLYRMVPYNYDSAPIGVPATMQLVEVEPDRRICEQHHAVHKDENMRCFLSTEWGSSVPCRWMPVVRVPKEDNDASA